MTSPSPSPSPKSNPQIPRGKEEFGLWAVSKILLFLSHLFFTSDSQTLGILAGVGNSSSVSVDDSDIGHDQEDNIAAADNDIQES